MTDIPTDTRKFRNWLKAHISRTPTAAYGLSDEFDEDELDGYTYFGIRAITGEKRPPRGHPVTIRTLDMGDHLKVETFSMSGDFAKFAGYLDQAVRDNWQVELKEQSKDEAGDGKIYTPTKQANLKRWQETWRAVRGMWNKAHKYPEILARLDNNRPELVCTEKTLVKIIKAGEAGLLD